MRHWLLFAALGMFALVLWLAAQDKKGVLPQTENAWRAAGYVEVRPGIWHRD